MSALFEPAVRVTEEPFSSNPAAGFTRSESTGFLTVTRQVADNPLLVLTVIFADPASPPKTFPDALTEATELLLEDQESSVSAPAG